MGIVMEFKIEGIFCCTTVYEVRATVVPVGVL